MRPWRDGALALAAGVAHTAAFAPLELWWLQIGALALLLWHVGPDSGSRRAAWLGWCFGLGWFAAGWWWLFISLHRFGGLAAPLSAAAVLVLAAAMALYPALGLALGSRLCRQAGPLRQALGFAGAWTLVELARGQWFTGFPWSASGYAHTSGPLAAWAPWVGVYGIGLVAATVAATVAAVVEAVVGAVVGAVTAKGAAVIAPDQPGLQAGLQPGLQASALPRVLPRVLPGAVLAAALVLGGLALPQAHTRPAGELTVSLLQTDIAQDRKFEPGRLADQLEAVALAMSRARGQLVVTPESALPLPLSMVEPAYWHRLERALDGRAALVGLFVDDSPTHFVNSMIGIGGEGKGNDGEGSAGAGATGSSPLRPATLYRYGKRHLLPFGEYIPPGLGWFVRALDIPLGDQAAGRHEAAFAVAGQRLRPLICYEDLFGEEFAAAAAEDDGARAATVFVNASNLAWFGTRMVLDQHLQFSRMRALEFQRPVIRATNTGATAVVDHRGQVGERLPPARAGLLEATVQGRRGATPYARALHALQQQPLLRRLSQALGSLWPWWAAAAALLLAASAGAAGAAPPTIGSTARHAAPPTPQPQTPPRAPASARPPGL